ncbi:MAG: nitronate monooxygenase [Actinobacteria bacterium]|nr:nitronate monooxygenase [Actinomycetota bacterium]
MRPLRIRGKTIPLPIVQGGMGVGISLAPLAGEVARLGGVGTVSTAALADLISLREGHAFTSFEAAAHEMRAARRLADAGYLAANVMCAAATTYADSVRGAVAGGADAIVSGAGLPVDLPFLLADAPEVALIPIVSSVRALRILVKQWRRRGAPRLADAVVVEGPLAGGHLGFKVEELEAEDNRLENLVPPVLEYVHAELAGVPVIAAGGIYSRDDVDFYLDMGCAGVQMGTRFLATVESSAAPEFKQALVETTREEIALAQPASPCGYPFRITTRSPRARAPKAKNPCRHRYLVDPEGRCKANTEPDRYACLCNSLLSSAGVLDDDGGLYSTGANGWRVDRVMTVREVFADLGLVAEPLPASH